MNGRLLTTRLMWFAGLWVMGVGITAGVGYLIRIWLT